MSNPDKRKNWREAIEQQQQIWYDVAPHEDFLMNTFSMIWIDDQNGIAGVYAEKREPPHGIGLVHLIFFKGKGWDDEKVQAWLSEHQKLLQPEEPEGIKAPSPKAPPPKDLTQQTPPTGNILLGDVIHLTDGTTFPKAAIKRRR